MAWHWIGGLASGLMTFPAAGLAWGLMWVTNKSYDSGIWFIAAPLRIMTFLMQMSVLFFCFWVVWFVAWEMPKGFYRASRGQDLDGQGRLSVKGYMQLLLLPVVMGLTAVLVGLFDNWLVFGKHGLGLIVLGYAALDWVLEIGSLVVIGAWLVILPIFLRKRASLLSGDNDT